MSLPASGQISMGDVRTELSLSGTIALNDSAVRSLFAVASGQISLNDGHGKSALNAALSGESIDTVHAPATYTLANSGSISASNGLSGTWLLGGPASSFEVFATVLSGTLTSGPTGSWVSLSTSRTWVVVANPGTFKSCTIQLQIRRTTDNAVLTTANITLDEDNS